jgi:AraC-like DNA-binding protein
VFKQHKGVTPQEYRSQIEAHRTQQEQQPKTVYHDRLDYTHGVPAPKHDAE